MLRRREPRRLVTAMAWALSLALGLAPGVAWAAPGGGTAAGGGAGDLLSAAWSWLSLFWGAERAGMVRGEREVGWAERGPGTGDRVGQPSGAGGFAKEGSVPIPDGAPAQAPAGPCGADACTDEGSIWNPDG